MAGLADTKHRKSRKVRDSIFSQQLNQQLDIVYCPTLTVSTSLMSLFLNHNCLSLFFSHTTFTFNFRQHITMYERLEEPQICHKK